MVKKIISYPKILTLQTFPNKNMSPSHLNNKFKVDFIKSFWTIGVRDLKFSVSLVAISVRSNHLELSRGHVLVHLIVHSKKT